ncbi:ABC transporter ATP-binding protein [Periweissella cryptocerci]|uniref:ABC transporter ATP-binding protein n=1 Tax=Periweissella cryptocerci TaxID=2506420 RepID=A0A4V1AIR1_9LACO|nr:ATP-binding cassette domain-containing protein [Periweissella cryptocerci]QBO36385.1 ABC transporter ATP-binding protein [Periweissella cryptocerci]
MTLQVKNLTKSIQNKVVLENVNIEFKTGEIVGLVGRNSVGLSTLLKTLTRRSKIDAGDVLYNGESIFVKTELLQKINFTNATWNFFSSNTLLQIAKTFEIAYPNFKTYSLLGQLEERGVPVEEKYSRLSTGMQALFRVMLGFATNAEYILLDEPLNGIDTIWREEVIEVIRKEMAARKVGVVITSHHLNELDLLADRIVILRNRTVWHEYAHNELNEKARKLQIVVRDEDTDFSDIPGTVIEHEGHVFKIVFSEYADETHQKIEALNPIFYEFLSVTLDDLYHVTIDEGEVEDANDEYANEKDDQE